MDFRWKNYSRPQTMATGGQAAYDAGMNNMGQTAAPVAVEPFADIRAKIAEKEAQLAEVNARIAEIDKSMPGLGDGREWEIAAKRAEIGDMSAYDSLLGRSAMANGAANISVIEAELKNAEKLLWGLESKNDEDRAMARNQIQVALRSAEEWQDKTGGELPASYDRLRIAIEKGPDGQNATELVNFYKYKMANGTLTESDREYVDMVLRPKMNSEDFDRLFSFLNESKGKTVESKKKAKDEAAKWEEWFNKVVNSSNVAGEIRKLNNEEYKQFKRRFDYDEKTGELKRK